MNVWNSITICVRSRRFSPNVSSGWTFETGEMTGNCDMNSSAMTAKEVSKVVWLLRNTITYGGPTRLLFSTLIGMMERCSYTVRYASPKMATFLPIEAVYSISVCLALQQIRMGMSITHLGTGSRGNATLLSSFVAHTR